MNDPIIVGRLTVIPLSIVQIGAVYFWMKFAYPLPKKNIFRTASFLIMQVIALAVPLSQINVFGRFTASKPLDDNYISSTILLEYLICFVLLFYYLSKKKKAAPDGN